MPTHSDKSPELPVGALGRLRVAHDSVTNVSSEVGPVLKAEPKVALTLPTAAAAATAKKMCWHDCGEEVMYEH